VPLRKKIGDTCGGRQRVAVGTVKTYLEPNEIELMEKVAACFRDRLLIRLLFRLGCRISEALALEVSDIDFERGTATILHLKTRIRLSCTMCKARLGRRHQFCPECGEEVNKARKRHQEHLGHVSFNATAKYRKVAGEEHRDWYDRLWNKAA